MKCCKSIITERKVTELSYYQIVFEWEDSIKECLDLDYLYMDGKYSENKTTFIWEIISLLKPFVATKNEWNIAHVMYPRLSYRYRNMNAIPIYLDIPSKWIRKIVWETRKLPVYFVTSMNAYIEISERRHRTNCIYLPLSIPDKYYTRKVPKKSIDVLQLGRRNPILHKYMLDYMGIHPEINYVYRDNGEYISTIDGIIGNASTREDYMSLLLRAKVSLVATPAIDGDKKFGGFDFFTPRFFESAICYCHLIGRYPLNREAGYFGITKICARVDSYKDFVAALEKKIGLDNAINVQLYSDFIEANLTSRRAILLKEELVKAGFQF